MSAIPLPDKIQNALNFYGQQEKENQFLSPVAKTAIRTLCALLEESARAGAGLVFALGDANAVLEGMIAGSIAIPLLDGQCVVDNEKLDRIDKQLQADGGEPDSRAAITMADAELLLGAVCVLQLRNIMMGQAVIDVLGERHRQIEEEGYTPDHDDEHACGEIAGLACFYAMPPAARDWVATSTGYGATLASAVLPEGWTAKTGERRDELVKAAALTIAEIERLDRLAESEVSE